MVDLLSMGVLPTIASGLVAFVMLRLLTKLATNKNRKYLPGPPRLPLIGNLLQMPATDAWETYLKWRDTYGDAIYLEVLGAPVVVLNTYQACIDLLEKRSDIYSDRPRNVVGNKIMGWDKSVVTAPYGDRWKRYRRISAQSLRKEVVGRFYPLQEKEIARFLVGLLDKPERFLEGFRFAAARGLLMAMYGIEVTEEHDTMITTAEQAMEAAVFAAQPGNFLVDFFPILEKVPSWVPGTGWKAYAQRGKELTDDMVNIPFNKTVDSMKTGNYEPSFTSTNLEKKEDGEIVKWCAGTMLSAGTDTSVANLHNFVLAMVLYPEVQKRIQAEIDSAVGPGRLPTMADSDQLPYLNAVLRELIRWQPISPIALPHRLTTDDVYNGYFIPAGTVVIANSWAVSRDPTLYKDPEVFNPDRFLPMFDKSIPHDPADIPMDPMLYSFGYGRRICAGKNYAEAMAFTAMARLMVTFNISMAKDSQGNDIVPELQFKSSVVREPVPFPCKITPRSEAARALVMAAVNGNL
ncbi:cytochrome P450 [Pholiota conissans]|uniref:Cytochrome P450 n=1 Tax=Pholiota conissans TaxID=109636 RepID=A0A9P5Z822_9AGAR|nr:cytochrome P450 [Pholiota conissans]